MKRYKIKSLFAESPLDAKVQVSGWVRSFRNDRFIAINDGSCLKTLQIVVDPDTLAPEILTNLTVGCAITVQGTLVESQGKGQSIELVSNQLTVVGKADSDAVSKTILQPKTFT